MKEERAWRSVLSTVALTCVLFVAFFVSIAPTFSSTLAYLGIFTLPPAANDAAIGLVGLFSFSCAVWRILRDRRIDSFLVCACLLFLLVLGASVVFPGSENAGVISLGGTLTFSTVHVFFFDWTPVLSMVFVVFAFRDDHQKELVWGMLIACTAYTLLNMKLLFEQVEAFTTITNLFTGHRNTIFRIAIPAYVCSLLIYLEYRRAWIVLPVIFYIIGLIQVIGAYSATTVCAMIVMGILSIVLIWRRSRRILNALTYGIGYVALFLGLVVFRLQNAFSPIIQALLHRNVTFTGRTLIWDQVFQGIQNFHILTGYGVGYMYRAIAVNGQSYKHAHNEFLHMLMMGGIIALGLYIALFVMSIRRLYIARMNSTAAALAVGVAGFLVVSLTEVSFSPGLFFLLALAYYFAFPQQKDLGKEQHDGEVPN